MNLALVNFDRPHSERLNINRLRATLFFEIKRNLPSEARASMKIAAPDLGDRLVDIYQSSDNRALKDLIERFFNGAGGDWIARLAPPRKHFFNFPRNPA